MGQPGMAGKRRKPTTNRGALIAFAGPIWARPVAVCRDFLPERSPHLALPPWTARLQGWWLESSLTAKTRLS